MNAHELAARHASSPLVAPLLSCPPREPRHFAAPEAAALAPALRQPAAREPESPWTTRAFDQDVPPVTLGDARARRDELRTLLSRERAAAADFLLALADFDRRRGWERLGHASLFSLLTRELGLSAGAAQLRLSAARLLPRHPAVEAALRDGRLCLSAAGQLARVLTPANEAEVLPRFFGCSSREAQEVAAAILPAPVPVRREVVTSMRAFDQAGGSEVAPPLALPFGQVSDFPCAPSSASHGVPCPPTAQACADEATSRSALALGPSAEPAASGAPIAPSGASATAPAPASSLHAHEVGARSRATPSTPQVVPLTADLRRLHLTVTVGFMEQVSKARTGLSHAIPGATTEQVLGAALAALLEKQARRKGLGRRALATRAKAGPLTPRPLPAQGGERQGSTRSAPTTSRGAPAPDRPPVPAALEREVRLRDGDRCTFPLDAGGTCGSTWQVELDHVLPVALGGATTLPNLRCLCRAHNQSEAREVLGRASDQLRP